ncbi:hypothetical protein F2Q69_00061328 [Brassica cretica]|uniref:Uncharacterized protein n=1 Tax=Brassica cretica TaxID=69181 RepID=A0A8S9RBB7_BRACR|nr:hypothetical protein F2Q69_00061328 [Brassica cretica]
MFSSRMRFIAPASDPVSKPASALVLMVCPCLSLGFSWFELIFPALESVACVLPSSGWVLPASADVMLCICGDAVAFNLVAVL